MGTDITAMVAETTAIKMATTRRIVTTVVANAAVVEEGEEAEGDAIKHHVRGRLIRV
jgi:hypothetical protein